MAEVAAVAGWMEEVCCFQRLKSLRLKFSIGGMAHFQGWFISIQTDQTAGSLPVLVPLRSFVSAWLVWLACAARSLIWTSPCRWRSVMQSMVCLSACQICKWESTQGVVRLEQHNA